jgi:hypothetical protein
MPSPYRPAQPRRRDRFGHIDDPLIHHSFKGQRCHNPSCREVITTDWNFDGLCRRCNSRRIRWGHVDQTPVSRAELRPHLKSARAARKRNATVDFESVYGAWRELVEWCQTADPVPTSRDMDARKLVVTIGTNASPETLLDIAIAVYILNALHPARFVNEGCFQLSLAHAFRRAGRAGQTPVKRQRQPGEKAKVYYREISIPTRLKLADLILEAFGPVASRLACSFSWNRDPATG